MRANKKIKVIMSKVGIDGHERGAKVVASSLAKRGMEVIYLGMYQNAKSIVTAALDENADVIGLSYLSGVHLHFTKRIIELLKKKEMMDDILILVGGTIPPEDIKTLKEMGVAGVFPPGSLIKDIEAIINRHKSVPHVAVP